MDLDNVYDNFSDNYIKPLRRKLPGNYIDLQYISYSNWSKDELEFKSNRN